MKVQGERTLEAPVALVWKALLDPEILAGTLQGCERLVEEAPQRFHGVLGVRVGPVQERFEGTVALSDLEPPRSFRIRLEGSGPHGFLRGDGVIRLEAADASTTVLRYELEAQVGGRIASVGQRLLDSSARAITRQALDGLGRQIQALKDGPEGSGEGAPRAAAPSQAEIATAVARDLVEELVPRGRRRILAMAGLMLLAAALALIVALAR